MHITLIGMSNIGKSYWSQRLAKDGGYERIACDALIERNLAPELAKHGYAGIRDVAKWMGQPFDLQYPETSAKYIACEREVMQEIIENLGSTAVTKPLVIDTTGSVIYLGSDIAEKLRALSRIIYFEASPIHMAQLFDRYIAHPKPVIWGEAYAPQNGETPQDAMKRCYPALLRGRAVQYEALAHITIPYEQHRAPNADIASLISKP